MNQTQTELVVINQEIFDDIREDYRNHSFEYLLGKYRIDQIILRKLLGSHDLEEFEKWVDEV